MLLNTKRLSLLGTLLAIILAVSITAPYVTAWWNLGMESREVNVINVRGETYMGFEG